MARNVVYGVVPAPAAPPAPPPPPDKYADKLVKYIPAEVIAFFLPTFALAVAKQSRWGEWLVLGTCVLGTWGYMAIRRDPASKPRWYFYLLSVLAFIAWALGTSKAAELVGMDKTMSQLTLSLAIFIVPLVDELLSRFGPAAPRARG